MQRKYTGYLKGSLTRNAKGNIVMNGPLDLEKELTLVI